MGFKSRLRNGKLPPSTGQGNIGRFWKHWTIRKAVGNGTTRAMPMPVWDIWKKPSPPTRRRCDWTLAMTMPGTIRNCWNGKEKNSSKNRVGIIRTNKPGNRVDSTGVGQTRNTRMPVTSNTAATKPGKKTPRNSPGRMREGIDGRSRHPVRSRMPGQNGGQRILARSRRSRARCRSRMKPGRPMNNG